MSIQMVAFEDLVEAVSFEELISPVAEAFVASSLSKAQNGQIIMFPQEDKTSADVLVKTATMHGSEHYLVKVAPWFANNVKAGIGQGGFIAVFDSHTGLTQAILDERHYLSDIRTAAAGAIAARHLAPAKVDVATVIGSGTQAYWQAIALHQERPYNRLLIWARDPTKASGLKDRISARLPGPEIICVADAETAVRSADVILTATLSREPIVRGTWLRPGQHITAVGADDETKCELDHDALRRARVFVDDIAISCDNGCVSRAIKDGRYSAEDLAGEIGNVIAGTTLGRRSPNDITIARFVGLGVQDLAAVDVALKKLANTL